MIVAVMQPYFFPYIGYFQLMNAVNVFVIYDDAQYMKGGWINRNRILVNGAPGWLTLPVKRASLSLPINLRQYLLEGDNVRKIKEQLRASYASAPAFGEVFSMVCELLNFKDSNVAAFNANLLTLLAKRLGIASRVVLSSELEKAPGLKGQDKVIDICKRLGATCYANPIGGLALYDPLAFMQSGIALTFLRARPTSYLQAGQPHVPFLSIIDVLMFNSREQAIKLLIESDTVNPCKSAG